jgi:hypothetical protein
MAFGIAAGLLVGVPISARIVTGHSGHGAIDMAITYLMMLVALSLVFVAMKRQRDEEGGGVIRFWPAFGFGLAISFVASIAYVAAFETAVAITHYDFIGPYADAQIAEKRAAGAGGRELADFVASMDELKRQFADPLFRLPMIFLEIFPVGILVSLVCAALLRKPGFMPARQGRGADRVGQPTR